MLKIKDNVDLKELEKFNYLDMGNCYQKYDYFGVQVFIDKQTREITRVQPYSLRFTPSYDEICELYENELVEEVGGESE